ncbi:sulfate ABC transporter permease subunit CysW [Oculatella sp. FACHB-28]|uniref:sulfate ABC transporter permease subunit CysW n=1 Tax=Oculatella sp. FACHB-28 TaxID=2692845 RepID=UPI00168504C6|nr:sulfate ABC transporter permease subunit CysW [Oculatella sp. FACHB-28]MBD2057558.1 sulfate ABC transporter permease subunit CysW [Oculatella sp. FACHB-28]
MTSEVFNPLSRKPSPKTDSKELAKKGEWTKLVLIGIVVVYLALVLLVPAINVFVQAFDGGIEGFLETIRQREFVNALKLTLLMAAIAVPLNTVFGICAALALARKRFPGRTLLISIIDLPFSVSPIVAGLMIVLLYGRNGWFGPLLESAGIKIIFAIPGMLLATIFVTLPFVAREVLPVLEEMGPELEEAAKTLGASSWQVFWRVTLPSIRWGLLYGLILTNARAMGEFGAIVVVSGSIRGKTQTLPLFVEEAYKQYQTQSAYAAAVLLALLAVVTLVLKEILERKTAIKDAE